MYFCMGLIEFHRKSAPPYSVILVVESALKISGTRPLLFAASTPLPSAVENGVSGFVPPISKDKGPSVLFTNLKAHFFHAV